MRTQADFFSALSNGAKWGVPVSISRAGSPDGGLPLDTYSIFKSKADAELYASQNKAAVEAAGMTNNAYVGQIVSVWNSDNSVEIYYINSDLTLKPVGVVPKGDNKLVSVSADGLITLFGAENATTGKLPVIDANNQIEWKTLEQIGAGDGNTHYTVTPIEKETVVGDSTVKEIYGFSIISDDEGATATQIKFDVYTKKETEKLIADAVAEEKTRAEAIEATLSEKIGTEAVGTEGEDGYKASTGLHAKIDTKANKADVYKKSETYSRDEVKAEIATSISGKLTKKIVYSVDLDNNTYLEIEAGEAQNAVESVIYLVADTNKSGGDIYREYMLLNVGGTLKLTQTGDTTTDLSDYAKTADIANEYLKISDANDADNGYLKKSDASSTYLNKTDAGTTYLSKETANTDYLKKTDASSTYLNKTDAGTTYVTKTVAEGSGSGDTKGVRFISQEEINKLGKLNLGDGGNLEVSGSVNANNVIGLYDRIRKVILNATDSSEDLDTNTDGTQTGLGIESGAQVNKIEAIKLDSTSNAITISDKTVVLNVYDKTIIDTKIKGVSDELSTLKETVNTHNTQYEAKIGTIEGEITSLKNKDTSTDSEISSIKTILNGENNNGLSATVSSHTTQIGTITGRLNEIEGADGLGSKVSTTTYNAKVAEIETSLGLKATKSELETLSSTVTNESGKLKSLSDKVDGMYTNSAIDTAISSAISTEDAAIKAILGTGFDSTNTVKKAIDDTNAKITTLVGNDTNKSVRVIASEVLAAELIPESAAESLDSLGEIAAWIQSHPQDAAAMNKSITALLGTDAPIDGNGAYTGLGTGSLVQSAIDASIAAITHPTASTTKLGYVMANDAENGILVDESGKMTINTVNVSKLVQTAGHVLILNGGTSNTTTTV